MPCKNWIASELPLKNDARFSQGACKSLSLREGLGTVRVRHFQG